MFKEGKWRLHASKTANWERALHNVDPFVDCPSISSGSPKGILFSHSIALSRSISLDVAFGSTDL